VGQKLLLGVKCKYWNYANIGVLSFGAGITFLKKEAGQKLPGVQPHARDAIPRYEKGRIIND